MKNKTLVDEIILEGIPEELIRPLLAISIRASRPQTIDGYKQLLKEIRKLTIPCGEAGGESLYYIRVRNLVSERMQAMLDAQTWARKKDPTAEAVSVDTNRWRVEIHSREQERNYSLLVALERAGVDYNRGEEKVRAAVTEATERDV